MTEHQIKENSHFVVDSTERENVSLPLYGHVRII